MSNELAALVIIIKRLQRDADHFDARVSALEDAGVQGLAERVDELERVPVRELTQRLDAVERMVGLQPAERLGLRERRERVAELNRNGLSDGQIARTLGVAPSTIVRTRREAGIPSIGVGGSANIGKRHPPSNGNGNGSAPSP